MIHSKRQTYEDGIGRIDEAVKHEFFLEATWITYAMLEDRCDSLLEKSGGIPSSDKFLSINAKLNCIKHRASTNPVLSQILNLEKLVEEVRSWKDLRNPLMHSMVKVARPWHEINSEAERLAFAGRELLGRFTAAAMKARKKFVRARSTVRK